VGSNLFMDVLTVAGWQTVVARLLGRSPRPAAIAGLSNLQFEGLSIAPVPS